MRKRKIVFCEFHFIQNFLTQQPSLVAPIDDSIRIMECWLSLYKFICSSDLVLNISREEFYKRKDENNLLSSIWKNGENIDFNTESFPDLGKDLNGDEILNSVILTTKDEETCNKISEKYGIIVINETNWKDKKHLYIDNGTAFPNPDKEIRDWNFLRQIPQLNICNSLIIIDNYLFDDNKNKKGETTLNWKNKLDLNLTPILTHLLPKNFFEDIKFEIILITGVTTGFSYEKQYKEVCSIIRNINSKLNFKLSLFLGLKDINKGIKESLFHDRCIISNNIWIGSGYGFGILGPTAFRQKPTTINVLFPYLQSSMPWVDDAFIKILTNVKEILATNDKVDKNYWGDDYSRTCRLVSHYFPTDEKLAETQRLQGLKILGKIDLSKMPVINKKPR